MKILGKPESSSDVINKHHKMLIIGMGWLGQHAKKYFLEADCYSPSLGLVDKDRNKTEMSNWEVAIVGVPTPMSDDGSCDTSYVENVVENWHNKVKLFIIRSTVKPGTIDSFQEKYPDNLFVMQAEFLGETLGHPMVEADRNTFVILGGKEEATRLASQVWMRVLHSNSHIHQVSGKTAELGKYMENCFLATKVTFVNDFRRLAEAMDVDFLKLREIWLADPRVGRSHTFAYKENPGFSGSCLPKDLLAISHHARYTVKQPLELVESLLRINEKMRKDIKGKVKLMPVIKKYADKIRGL